MGKKGQTGVIIMVVLIVIVGVFFLYKEGYINFNNTTSIVNTQNLNPYVPISFNISSVGSLAHVYTGENINFVSNIFNHGKSYLNVVVSPYGCQFMPILNKSFLIPPNSPSTYTWNFSSTTPTSCSVTFSACFNAVSYTNYPITIESYNFSGKAPLSSQTSSSGLPISLALESFNPTIVSSPVTTNQTEYVESSALTSDGSTSKLNWVNIHISNGEGYFISSTGGTYSINPSINISSQLYPLNFQYGRLLAPVPFTFVVTPVSSSIGYNSDISINISAGYTYCLTSSTIPLTVNQP